MLDGDLVPRRVVSSQPCSRIQRRRARATSARLHSSARRLFLKVTPWRAKKRDNALRLAEIRRLRSIEMSSFNVRFLCLLMRARICCEYFSNGEVLPTRGIGLHVPSLRKRCSQRIAELALTYRGLHPLESAALSRRTPIPDVRTTSRRKTLIRLIGTGEARVAHHTKNSSKATCGHSGMPAIRNASAIN